MFRRLIKYKLILLLFLFYFKANAQFDVNKKIDSLINTSIENKNFPGGQLFVKIKDSITINKSYGYHTYDSIISVKNTHLYDLASLTKVLAATFSLMKLYDENKLELNDKLEANYKKFEAASHETRGVPAKKPAPEYFL